MRVGDGKEAWAAPQQMLLCLGAQPATHTFTHVQANSDTFKELNNGLDTILHRLSPNYETYAQCLIELGEYLTKSGEWAKVEVWAAAERMPAWKWWLVHNHFAPSLAVRGYAACLLLAAKACTSLHQNALPTAL